jgi:surface-anchored protein
VPDDPRYTSFLEPAGHPVWILPQSAKPSEISMGVGTSRIAPNVFSRNEIFLSLQRFEGPGRFAMYNTDSRGAPELIMATSDGVNPAVDRLAVPALGGHLHMNWAFTAPGTYRLGFSASGVIRSTGQNSESPIVDYSFLVEDREPPRLLSPRFHSGDAFAFRLESATNALCRVESSPDLRAWNAVMQITNSTGVIELQLPIGANSPAQFFRVLIP